MFSEVNFGVQSSSQSSAQTFVQSFVKNGSDFSSLGLFKILCEKNLLAPKQMKNV